MKSRLTNKDFRKNRQDYLTIFTNLRKKDYFEQK